MWALATGAGVAALLQASRPAFMALRYVGAAYLIYLGIEALRAARRMRPADDQSRAAAAAGLPPRRAYRQGVMSNLANPKIAVFFTSLLPQFARGGEFEALVLLGVVFAALTLAWLTAYACVVAKAAGVFRRGRLQRNLEALAGATLFALGLRVATDS
jgi:threonine/homoserine/homoserine lactone efflux protein